MTDLIEMIIGLARIVTGESANTVCWTTFNCLVTRMEGAVPSLRHDCIAYMARNGIEFSERSRHQKGNEVKRLWRRFSRSIGQTEGNSNG